MRKFTAKQHAFILAFVACNNASEAARRAGYSAKGANVTATKLLANPSIATEIDRRRGAIIKKLAISGENLVVEVGRVAFSDMRRVFHPDGRLKAIRDLDDDTAAAVASVEVRTTAEGERVTKIRFWSKPEAQRNLAVMMGLGRNGRQPEERNGMEAQELRESLAALSAEQRASLREIAETLVARRKAVAEGSTSLGNGQHRDDRR